MADSLLEHDTVFSVSDCGHAIRRLGDIQHIFIAELVAHLNVQQYIKKISMSKYQYQYD